MELEYPIETFYTALSLVEAAAEGEKEKAKLMLSMSSPQELQDLSVCLANLVCTIVDSDHILDMVADFRNAFMELETNGEIQ